MPDAPHPPTATLRDTRERTVQALCRHFANDALDMAEFERRLDVAHRAHSAAELERLLIDLPALPVPAGGKEGAAAPAAGSTRAPAARAESAPPAAAPPRERQFVVGIMGGATRRGRWLPARRIFVEAVMGGVELDFREAQLTAGTTEVLVICLMGGVGIIVPPGLAVECGGFALMGGFDNTEEVDAAPAPGRPRLRINGFACMGAVEVDVRLPGESARQARKRRKRSAWQ
ncbi:MAG: DUF1707 and DUF2154 domain-containing protein [Gemmatimonadetes bacterium]|nr:DUF1707 and DUF2154 domain-containing protein [Gemmatimonadota bacterium]